MTPSLPKLAAAAFVIIGIALAWIATPNFLEFVGLRAPEFRAPEQRALLIVVGLLGAAYAVFGAIALIKKPPAARGLVRLMAGANALFFLLFALAALASFHWLGVCVFFHLGAVNLLLAVACREPPGPPRSQIDSSDRIP